MYDLQITYLNPEKKLQSIKYPSINDFLAEMDYANLSGTAVNVVFFEKGKMERFATLMSLEAYCKKMEVVSHGDD